MGIGYGFSFGFSFGNVSNFGNFGMPAPQPFPHPHHHDHNQPYDSTVGRPNDGKINTMYGQAYAPGIEGKLSGMDKSYVDAMKGGKINPMEMFSMMGQRMQFEQMLNMFKGNDGQLDGMERVMLNRYLDGMNKNVNTFSQNGW